MNFGLRFLGVGNATADALGCSAAVIERDGAPLLLIDCGPDVPAAYARRYDARPTAIYLTHAHMDHVGGMERLFYETYFDRTARGRVRLYAHAALVPVLQARLADFPELLAEGGANFWDAFQLVPVSHGFWHDDIWFDVFPTRHHGPNSSFGLAAAGSFVWTGDTRPIPEMLEAHAAHGEMVAHDCALIGNPSHTGLDDLEREYAPELRARLILYHYASEHDGAAMRAEGYRVARAGEALELSPPLRMLVGPAR